ncbi:MAG: hypothetical protein KF871_10950 [Hydrogenophaga sp.]|uniref:hypothetical protein n=1 Tax=Hydrogenophaga sp. TaxID=1904254 RepID=UPI001DC5FB8C|nr:hypothetical protein [Hydrogenophaga sp.]MBX3610400.1 hypothetical protein [Hydrogenophaga sp.]
MNVQEKLVYAKRAIQSITEHDDAPSEEVAGAVDELQKFAGEEFKKALKRRAEKAKASKKAAAIKG